MTKVKLGIRVRPFTEKELKSDNDRFAVVCVNDENTVTITNIKVNASGAGDSRERVRRYNADYTFNSACSIPQKEYSSQEKIFETIGREVLSSISQGLSACVLAYGQSATGKTYTMMGTESHPGLIPRLCRALGEENLFDIKVSFLEIYNERVHDLLAGEVLPAVHTFNSLPRRKGNTRKDLRVREHPTRGPYVQNLRRVSVRDVEALLSLVAEGTRRRRTATTRRNPSSSRSHALLELRTPRATLHLADLAGSEKASWEGCGGGRQKEGANINKSLVALSNVISALVNEGSSRCKFVPYRDSALTWLLKDCFTGGSNIFIIATVSPSAACYGESASTLRWAAQARCLRTTKTVPATIVNRATLQAQLNRLLSELNKHHIRYVPESGNIIYDDEHWALGKKNLSSGNLKNETKIGNIMNMTLPKTDAVNSESTNSSLASRSLDVNNIVHKNDDIASAINKEVDKLFGTTLERTRSGSALEIIAPVRHKKRQYSSQEILPMEKTIHGGNVDRISDEQQYESETNIGKKYNATVTKTPQVPILYDNQRAEIIASVTERLYSKFKKDAAANKMDSIVDKKIMQPLGELKICTNARQRLIELSQKAIRNKRRIGIPAHTQTRKTVIRVKDQGINIQTDLESYIMHKNDSKILYRNVGTETYPVTPRYKEVAVGDSFLGFHDKSTSMELKKISTQSACEMTDIIVKHNCGTQTQASEPPKRKEKSLVSTKLHNRTINEQKCVGNYWTSPIINISISPIYSLDSDSVSSNESIDIDCTENRSGVSGTTPDLLTTHNSIDTQQVMKQSVLGMTQNEDYKKHVEIPSFPDFDDTMNEDFPGDEVYTLPRKNNTYPYNKMQSPITNKKKMKIIKGTECEDLKNINDFYAHGDSVKEVYDDSANVYLDNISDTSDSNDIDVTWTRGSLYKTASSQSKHDIELNYSTRASIYNNSSAQRQCCVNKRERGADSVYELEIKERNPFIKDKNCDHNNFENIERKILKSCNGLEKVASNYEDYLENYSKNQAKSPTEYLQYLVELRREVVKKSVTCSSSSTSSH